MFGFFNKNKKASELEVIIKKEGIENVVEHIAALIAEKIPSQKIAHQFVLEELEAASMGNDDAINFVKNSGISPDEFKGAMNNSMPEVDGAGGPQQILLKFVLQLKSNPSLMVEFRVKVVDKIMKTFSIGKYNIQSIDLLVSFSALGKQELVKGLISNNDIDIDECDKSGWPALIVACQYNHIEIVKILLDNFADVDVTNGEDLTALIIASKDGNKKIVELLIDNGADIDFSNSENITALLAASTQGHHEIVKILLENGANIDSALRDGTTCLMMACILGHTDVVRTLVNYDADIDIENQFGQTAISCAMENGHEDIAQILTERWPF